MTTITRDRNVTTLINVFTVDPANQERLLKVLEQATERVIRHLPGFVSANFHRSLDNTRVVNYAQWESPEDLQAMLADQAAQAHLAEAKSLAKSVEPHLYEVHETFEPSREAPSEEASRAAA